MPRSDKRSFAGFWLREVAAQYDRADTLLRFTRASLALRGFEMPGTVDDVMRRCEEGDVAALQTARAAGRDYQVLGRAAVVKLTTSRTVAVLQGYVTHKFGKDSTHIARCPVLLALMMKDCFRERHLSVVSFQDASRRRDA